jgi:hypothetical protein
VIVFVGNGENVSHAMASVVPGAVAKAFTDGALCTYDCTDWTTVTYWWAAMICCTLCESIEMVTV